MKLKSLSTVRAALVISSVLSVSLPLCEKTAYGQSSVEVKGIFTKESFIAARNKAVSQLLSESDSMQISIHPELPGIKIGIFTIVGGQKNLVSESFGDPKLLLPLLFRQSEDLASSLDLDHLAVTLNRLNAYLVVNIHAASARVLSYKGAYPSDLSEQKSWQEYLPVGGVQAVFHDKVSRKSVGEVPPIFRDVHFPNE